MVVQELKPSEYAQRALDLLKEADAHLASGEYDSISAKLWGAVEYAVMAAAAKRGWKCAGGGYSALRPIVERLGEDLTRTYDAASLFYDNVRYTFLDDYEFEFFIPSAHRFVSKTLKLNEAVQDKVTSDD